MTRDSQLRRFLRVFRAFGSVIVMRVVYSKVRGWLHPASALPDPPGYNVTPRDVSVLLDAAQHPAATVDAVVEAVAARGGAGWEVCICERVPVAPDVAQALARWRGTQPWIRIVRADPSVDGAMAARWTVEQATGQFVAVVTPGYEPDADDIAELLAILHDSPALDAAVMAGTVDVPENSRSNAAWIDCRLLLQRKSGYLMGFAGRPFLSALPLAKALHGEGVPIAYVPCRGKTKVLVDRWN